MSYCGFSLRPFLLSLTLCAPVLCTSHAQADDDIISSITCSTTDFCAKLTDQTRPAKKKRYKVMMEGMSILAGVPQSPQWQAMIKDFRNSDDNFAEKSDLEIVRRILAELRELQKQDEKVQP